MTSITPTDEDIAEALRLFGYADNIRSINLAKTDCKGLFLQGETVMAHARTLAKLRVAMEALQWIDTACPVTCDMTLAHEMAHVANEALAKLKDPTDDQP